MPLGPLAASVGTPCWVYGAATLAARLQWLREAMAGIALHYAVKANDAPPVLRLVAATGLGADVVSGGELAAALAAGFPASRVVFSGVGKTTAEMRQALAAGVGQINVESAEELTELSALATACGAVAPVALRVNPDVAAGTHDKIATGRQGDKFGIARDTVADLYAQGAALPGLRMEGLAVHIGSQIMRMAPYAAAYARVAEIAKALQARGLAVPVIDAGGGLGYDYEGEGGGPAPAAWAATMRAAFGPVGARIAAEPGRVLVAPSGLLLSEVVRVRRAGMDRPMVVLDAAMTELLRPALYGALHRMAVLDPRRPAEMETCDVVGPVCESSDVFARGVEMPRLARGDVVAVLDAGAYGAVMSSTYNGRGLAPILWLERGEVTVVRQRG